LHSRTGFTPISFLIFLAILGLVFLAQRYWVRTGLRATRHVGSQRWREILQMLITGLAAWLVVIVFDRLFVHFIPRRGPGLWMITAAQLWLIPSTFGYLLIKVVHGVEWVWNALTRPRAQAAAEEVEEPPRRTFFRYAAGLLGAVPVVAAVYGFARERFDFRVRQVEIPVPNLPPALDGLRLVQLSDIHIGDFMPVPEVRRAVQMANRLGADIAFVTGDFITGSRDPLEQCIAELAGLKAPLGVWGCNGNHEIYAEAEDRSQDLFQQHGMRLLRQESAVLNWKGAGLNLIGVDYQRQHEPMLVGMESLVRRDMPNILLSHNPNTFYRAAELGIELSLAGHTHGGQVQVEIVDHRWSPARFITRFISGLYSLPMNSGAKAHLYVNRGLGTIAIPARLGVDPEITLITLKRA
jgi:uncharacterized protein